MILLGLLINIKTNCKLANLNKTPEATLYKKKDLINQRLEV